MRNPSGPHTEASRVTAEVQGLIAKDQRRDAKASRETLAPVANILVTGGSGFIGTNFIRYWLAEHPADRVVNYDLLTYAANPTNLGI